jgi:hypothetical protein
MSRNLKFRAWDKLNKSFIYSHTGHQEHYILTLDGRFQNLQNGSGGDEYVVQQFTGLKDKNGKEIYEGDVIRGYFDMGPAGMTINTAIVRWTNKEGYQWVYWDLNSIEVVGNIFDNLELLKL